MLEVSGGISAVTIGRSVRGAECRSLHLGSNSLFDALTQIFFRDQDLGFRVRIAQLEAVEGGEKQNGKAIYIYIERERERERERVTA